MFELAFEKGNPVAIDGVAMSPATILTKLNELGGEGWKEKGGMSGRGAETHGEGAPPVHCNRQA